MMLHTDRALLMGYREAKRDTLEAIYNEYARPIAAFLRDGFTFSGKSGQHHFAGIHSAYELDNALQEVFARAFSEAARQRYDGIRPFASYLFAIARNWAIDQGRRARIERSVPLDDVAETLCDETQDAKAAETVEGHEIDKLIRLFIAGRDDLDQRIYALRFSEDHSQSATAQNLGLTRIQVRRREAKLLRDLFHHLREHGYLTHAEISASSLAGRLGPTAIAVWFLIIVSGGRL